MEMGWLISVSSGSREDVSGFGLDVEKSHETAHVGPGGLRDALRTEEIC